MLNGGGTPRFGIGAKPGGSHTGRGTIAVAGGSGGGSSGRGGFGVSAGSGGGNEGVIGSGGRGAAAAELGPAAIDGNRWPKLLRMLTAVSSNSDAADGST